MHKLNKYILDKSGNFIFDKNETKLKNGDIIDIHQTVNGVRTFVIFSDDDNILDNISYYHNNTIGRNYEYDYDELLEINIHNSKYWREKEIEIINNIFDYE